MVSVILIPPYKVFFYSALFKEKFNSKLKNGRFWLLARLKTVKPGFAGKTTL
jgi:hypothetical protein